MTKLLILLTLITFNSYALDFSAYESRYENRVTTMTWCEGEYCTLVTEAEYYYLADGGESSELGDIW